MPGNKNSGRKRKATPVQGSIIASLRKRRKTAALTASPQVSLAPGRTRQGTKLAPVPSISNTTRPEIHPLQSPRLASKEFEKVIGPSLFHFPKHHLPQKRALLQRWKGLQIESNFNKRVTTRDHARTIWKEVKEIWLASRIPLMRTEEKNFVDKIVNIITEFQALKRAPEKRSTECYQLQLNSLFDVSLGDDAVEAALKASRSKDWVEDLEFYRGQKKHPQLYSMGGVDLKLAVKEKATAERRTKAKKRAEEEAIRSSSVTRYVIV